jgi:glycosyltransferase
MKVTIITVAYNSAGTIADTLASVAAQTYADIEHIVIDGSSTDATLDLVHRHPHVAYCVSEPDRGIYDAMNKGIALATGALIGFLNADDVLNGAGAVGKLVHTAKQACDLVYADLVYVRNDDLDHVVRHWHAGAFRLSRLRFGWMPPHPTFYVKRALLQKVGDFDTSLQIAADYDFMLRCLRHPSVKAAYLPRVLVRMRAGGVSNASIRTIMRKSREDLSTLRRHRVGGLLTLAAKNLRKVPQFFRTGSA